MKVEFQNSGPGGAAAGDPQAAAPEPHAGAADPRTREGARLRLVELWARNLSSELGTCQTTPVNCLSHG